MIVVKDYSPVLIYVDSKSYPFIMGIACWEKYVRMGKDLSERNFSVLYAIHQRDAPSILGIQMICNIWNSLEGTQLDNLQETSQTKENIQSAEKFLKTPICNKTLIPLERIISFGSLR